MGTMIILGWNVSLSVGLQGIFDMIQALQIIILLPLFDSVMPANTGVFFGHISSIAAYDIIEIGEYLDQWLQLLPTDPVNFKFETIGF